MDTAGLPPSDAIYGNELPFSTFVRLVDQLGALRPRPARQGKRRHSAKDTQVSDAVELLRSWIADRSREARSRGTPDGRAVLFFRLFFPEEGVRRRYDLREQKLAQLLAKVYQIPLVSGCSHPGSSESVSRFSCFGAQLSAALASSKRGGSKGKGKQLSLGRVDALLDELASLSPWSAPDVQNLGPACGRAPRPASDILADLFLNLDPSEAAVMAQLILRDLRALLYPPPTFSPGASLIIYNSAAFKTIDLQTALNLWTPGAYGLYRAVANLDFVAWHIDQLLCTARARLPRAEAVLGLPVQVPKTQKPGSCRAAGRRLYGQVAAETKYDGERLQIHVDVDAFSRPRIKIYSKSGRDSTQDRRQLHPIIKAALGLHAGLGDEPVDPLLLKRLRVMASTARAGRRQTTRRLILEGEMVPFDEERGQIAEFWRLGLTKHERAEEDEASPGSEPGFSPKRRAAFAPESYETGGTGQTPSPGRKAELAGDSPACARSRLHLKIVWFDCLLVDDRNLLHVPYAERRAALESVVSEIQGYSSLAGARIIDFDGRGATDQLRAHFAKIITDRCEGLMLKPLSSHRLDYRPRQQWMKLKKDFIPGAGDTLDFYVVGASHNLQRARELLAPPATLTTFFVGVLVPDLTVNLFRTRKPHFHILFSTSYGINREQLALLNDKIHERSPLHFEYPAAKCAVSPFDFVGAGRKDGQEYPIYTASSCSFTFSLADHLRGNAVRPWLILRKPMVFELNGAGFQKERGCPYYSLRWPRILKFDRPQFESDPVDLSRLQAVAKKAVGDKSGSEQLIEQLMNRASTPAPESPEAWDAEWKRWYLRLAAADGVEPAPDALSRLAPRPPSTPDSRSSPLRLLGSPAQRSDAPSPSQRVVEASFTSTSSLPSGTSSADFAWTILPPPAAGPLRTPRRAHLGHDNYFESPFELVRQAGHRVVTDDGEPDSPGSSPNSSRPRAGFIFVADGPGTGPVLTWFRKHTQRAEDPGAKPVLVLKMSAFDTFGTHLTTRVSDSILYMV